MQHLFPAGMQGAASLCVWLCFGHLPINPAPVCRSRRRQPAKVRCGLQGRGSRVLIRQRRCCCAPGSKSAFVRPIKKTAFRRRHRKGTMSQTAWGCGLRQTGGMNGSFAGKTGKRTDGSGFLTSIKRILSNVLKAFSVLVLT